MKKKVLKKVAVIFVLMASVFFYWNSYNDNKGLRVISWEDNYYNEENIELYYEPIKADVNDKRLNSLEKVYKINEIISKEDGEINKALRIVDMVKQIVTYDGVPSSLYANGYDILKEKGESKKVSERDMAIITRDLFLSYGYEARVGEFRKESPQFEKNTSYYVVEYWSGKYNKWIMIDFKTKGYVESEGSILSSDEFLFKDLKDVTFVGEVSDKEYKKTMKPYLKSYSIAIDNTLDSKKSNSYITLVKTPSAVDMKSDGKTFMEPTIYTTKQELFQSSPWANVIGQDERGYLIFKKKNESTTNMNEQQKEIALNTFIIGGFKDSSVMKSYYIKINDGDFEEVLGYKEYEFQVGKNTIELSLDGVNSCSEVVIIRDK